MMDGWNYSQLIEAEWHIYVLVNSYNGLSPVCGQAIIWTTAGLLLIQLMGTNFSEILI